MANDLFRKEVGEARGTLGYGKISLAQPLPIWILTGVAGTAALAIALIIIFSSYTRRHTVSGQLVPSKGLATVISPSTGVVQEIFVDESSAVEESQPVVVIVTPRATLASGDTNRALEDRLVRRETGLDAALRAREILIKEGERAVRSQIQQAAIEVQQIEDGIATKREQIRISAEILERMQRLEKSNYVSLLQIRQQESSMLELSGQLQALLRQGAAAQRSVIELEKELSSIPAQVSVSLAEYQLGKASLEQERVELEARGALLVSAPIDGVITAQFVKAGQAVQADQPLMSVMPKDGVLEAELLIPSRSIGFIAEGDKVRLRYEAFPYQKFGHQRGVVTKVSRSSNLTANSREGFSGSEAESLYRVVVALERQSVTAYGVEEPLRAGMRVEADVLGERRRFVEWLFEPLYSVRGKLANG